MGMYVRFQDPLIQIHTPAKLNLFLEVLGRRKDGFHEIETLMTPISMFDTLDFSAHPGGEIRLRSGWSTGVAAQRAATTAGEESPWDDLPVASENLVVKALERLRQRAGVETGIQVRLIKRIPAAAGLGGASSDAAAALVGGNGLWRLGWSRSQLAEVAAEVGSDVPFFLQDGAAICRGRGERIERLGRGVPLHVVLVRPPAGLSTAAVYRHCQPAETPYCVQGLAAAVRGGCPESVGRRMFNRLQAPAERLSPWVARLRAAFASLGCAGHQLSGSGTTYFGVCRHARHARHVAGRLRSAGWGAVFQVTTSSWAAGREAGEPH